jgi:hypothetical protein
MGCLIFSIYFIIFIIEVLFNGMSGTVWFCVHKLIQITVNQYNKGV